MDQLWRLATAWYGTRLQRTSRRPQPAEMREIAERQGKELERKDTFHYLLNSKDPVTGKKFTTEELQTIDEILASLPAEKRLEGVSVEQLLAALPPETREALARRLKTSGSPSNPE